MKYFANWSANCGMASGVGLTDTNKARLIRDVRTVANDLRSRGSDCFWAVYDEYGLCVAAGSTLSNGRRCRVPDGDLKYYGVYQ